MASDRIEEPSRPARAVGSPIILFDGVCNLCNAAVQWVVARDRRKVFSFASLQSRATANVLRDAGVHGSLPDSVVLVDAAGVHTKSDAAIRIARRLGFPWVLASAFVLVPRPLRDGLYALVARNRYHWFGRRESCMVPTPDLRARWLDADEPVVPASPAAGTPARDVAPAVANAPGLAWTLVLRFILAYFVIYLFPFPLGALPLTRWLAAPYLGFMRVLVPWIGQSFFGVTVTQMYNGSGDRTYDYVEHFANVLLALLVTVAWTAWRRGRPVSARVFAGVTTYVRYGLAAILLGYGWSKVFPLQFPEPGPDRLLSTYGDSSPMGLLWTSWARARPTWCSPVWARSRAGSSCSGGGPRPWVRSSVQPSCSTWSRSTSATTCR
jgi:predicted DCC family thiol-disulfide oxidoreductase YuxK